MFSTPGVEKLYWLNWENSLTQNLDWQSNFLGLGVGFVLYPQSGVGSALPKGLDGNLTQNLDWQKKPKPKLDVPDPEPGLADDI